MSVNPYNKTLLDLSKAIKTEELEQLKFLVEDRLGAAAAENVRNSLQLLKFLRDRGEIEEGDNSLLYDLLGNVNLKVQNDFFDKDTKNLRVFSPPSPFYASQYAPFTESQDYGNTTDPCNAATAYVASAQVGYSSPSNPVYGAFPPGAGECDPSVYSSFATSSTASTARVSDTGSEYTETVTNCSPSDISSEVASTTISFSEEHRLADLKIVDYDNGNTEVKTVASDGCQDTDVTSLPETVTADGAPARELKASSVYQDTAKASSLVERCVDLLTDSVINESNCDNVVSGETIGEAPSLGAVADNDESRQAAVAQDHLELPISPDTGRVDHSIILSKIRFDNVQLRRYQLSLAEPGLRGENSIVVLQTGAGKTHIAAYVTKYHR